MPRKTKQILIIDISALFHRAWHALPPLTTPAGEPIQAVFGLAKLMVKALGDIEPDYVVAALDSPGKTFRHEISDAYKANRPEAPHDLKSQFPKIPELLRALGVSMLSADGFEADDVIGRVVQDIRTAHPDVSVLILSGDKDVWQLIDDKTTVLNLKKGVSELERIGEDDVFERFGVAPARIPEFKALAGDPSDNIQGIRGMGEKTTKGLLSLFPSIDAAYDALADGKNQNQKILVKFADKLTENKADVYTGKNLATIRKDTPVIFVLNDTAWRGIDSQTAAVLFRKWGFRGLLEKSGNSGSADGSSQKSVTEELIADAETNGLFPPGIAELERKLIPVFSHMTKTGILVETKSLSGLSKEFTEKKEFIEKQLFSLAGKSFNPASSDQVREVLVRVVGEKMKKARRTPGGKSSTAMRELKRLGEDEPFIKNILAWRELAKLLSTYIDALPRSVSPKDGKIHTTFLQLGAATGRISSVNPNLQNIPVKTEYGRSVRNAFIASPRRVFVSADYSQIELRVIAHLSGDETMIAAFASGEDIHARTAAKVFGTELSDITKDMRNRAKTLNFGILYGMGPRRLAEETNMSYEEAADFIEQYFAQFPAVRHWMESAKQAARESGYAETMFGRRRMLPEILSEKANIRAQGERLAVNTPIQGTAADIVKMALVSCADFLRGSAKYADMILQVHDEILFEVEETKTTEVIPEIKNVMENLKNVPFELEVDIAAGKRWGDVATWGGMQ